ncbi:hypothetical protein AB5I41_14825 [Sphingomonas sp. MMS24-JH45]
MESPFFPLPSITVGGLRVEEEFGLVRRDDGSTILGLYAAGRTAIGVCSNLYMSGLSAADCASSPGDARAITYREIPFERRRHERGRPGRPAQSPLRRDGHGRFGVEDALYRGGRRPPRRADPRQRAGRWGTCELRRECSRRWSKRGIACWCPI